MKKRILFKVEKGRVLVPVGEPCPFGCRYCYTRGREIVSSWVSAEDILMPFRRFAQETSFDTIQLGYDGDPFARPARGLAMLKRLALLGKHLNFSTKALLDGSTLEALSEIRRYMESIGTTLSALVSVSCWDSAAVIEPHTPTPGERMLTVANLARIGVPVFIAVRPILPHIADSEYERIADEGLAARCDGFILGPLYADDHGQFVRFVPPEALESTPAQRCSVPWSAHTPTWTRYEDTDRLHRLLAMIEQRGGRIFLSSADAMDEVCQRETVP